MNTARISSTRSLPTICLTLLLGIGAHSLTPAHADPPADSSAKPTPNKDFAGTWRGKINGADLVWITDGRTWSTYIEGQPTPFIAGTFEAGFRAVHFRVGLPGNDPDGVQLRAAGIDHQRVCFKKALALDPGNAAAQKGSE